MGSVWGLAVSLLVFCWKVGVTAISAGLSIGSSAPLVTTNNMDRSSSEGAFQTTDLTQGVPPDTSTLSTETASNTLTATRTSSEVNSRDTQTVSPVTETRKTQTTSPTVSTLDIQTTYPTVSTLGIQTTSPTVSTLDIQTTSPTVSTLGIQTTSPTVSTLDIQTTSPTVSTLDIQTTSPTVSTLDIQTTSPTSPTLDIQTTSPPASTLETQTPSLVAFPTDTQTNSPAALSLDTQTTFPATEALENQTISPVDLTLKTQTISPVPETRTLAVRTPSKLVVVRPVSTDTSTTRGSPRTGVSTVKTPIGAIIDTLCIDDSSEEARKITIDLLTLAHTSTEAEHLSSESSSSSDSSQILGLDLATPAKDLVAFSITHIKLTTCITEIETSVITSNTNNSPTEATALSTSEMLTLPQPPKAKLLSSKTTSSPGTLSTAGTSTLATTLGGTPPISGVTEREATVGQIPTSGGTSVTVSPSPLNRTFALSTATQRHVVLGTTTVPRATGSVVGEATSFTGSSTSDNSLPAGVTTKSSTPSETLTSSSLAKTTASPKTPMKPLTSTPTAAGTRTTKHDPGEDGGFLLVRLSVASPEDLTEPKAIEKLMHQLSCDLHTHMPLVQVSLLSVRRD